MITKRNVFLVAAACSILLILLDVFDSNICSSGQCFDFIYDVLFPTAWIIFAVLGFSILMRVMNEKIFRAWAHFMIWFVPVSILLIVVSPNTGGGFLYPSQREMLSILLPILFSVISFIIIAWKYFATRSR